MARHLRRRQGPGFGFVIGQPPLDELANGEGERSRMGEPGRIGESKGPKEEPQIAPQT